MDGAVLTDEHAAVNGHDVVFRKNALQCAPRAFILFLLTVDWEQDGTIEHKIVGIGGRQSFTILHECIGKWYGNKIESFSLRIAE